jgi:hypothetical protein
MDNKTFERVGVSTKNGKTRVRFTNSKNREIILIKDGHDDITFFELSEPMTKPQAVTFLVERKEDFESLADRCAIDEANDKYNTVVTKGTRNSIAKPNLDEIKERAADAVAEEA